MPHFKVNIILPKEEVTIGKIEKMLEPYDYNKEMEPYVLNYRRNAEKDQREELNRLKNILDRQDENYKLDVCKERYDTISQMTAQEYYDHLFGSRGKDEEGNILFTYNLNGKWESWSVNELKDNCCSVEQAMKEKKIPFALVLPDGKWLQISNMERWLPVDEIPPAEWENIVIANYQKYPEHMVVQIDCHI